MRIFGVIVLILTKYIFHNRKSRLRLNHSDVNLKKRTPEKNLKKKQNKTLFKVLQCSSLI